MSKRPRYPLLSVSHVRESPVQTKTLGHVPEVIRDMGLAVEIARRLGEE